MSAEKPIVVSVGGSLIVPDHIDTDFLSSLKESVTGEMENGRSFIIIVGGGKTARRYMSAAQIITELAPDDIDWLGIHATRLNGHLLRTVFRDVAYPVMITNPDDILDVPDHARLVIAAGYRPGASTDLRAVQIAGHVGAEKMINLSNIDYVYTDDPKKNPEAEKIEDMTWSEFRTLIPDTWDPGLSAPFDPVAAREAERSGLEVAIINGAALAEFKKYLNGGEFIGTRIHS